MLTFNGSAGTGHLPHESVCQTPGTLNPHAAVAAVGFGLARGRGPFPNGGHSTPASPGPTGNHRFG